jgi:prevent-host-death family protein
MRSVGLKTLKNKLSEYVRMAAQGETVLITDRDRVVAELGPAQATRANRVADALLADAVRSGLITPALMPPGPPPEAPRVAPLREIVAELGQDRGER